MHALLLLYEQDDAAAVAMGDGGRDGARTVRVTVVHQLPLDLGRIEGRVAREHFGFADGMSQPIPYDEKSGTSA